MTRRPKFPHDNFGLDPKQLKLDSSCNAELDLSSNVALDLSSVNTMWTELESSLLGSETPYVLAIWGVTEPR